MEFLAETLEPNLDDNDVKASIRIYLNHLLDTNRKVNLVSRQMTADGLTQLVNETILLNSYITHDVIIDAGSGSGILGIPIALMARGDRATRRVVLIEPNGKKYHFLEEVKQSMNLVNVDAYRVRLEEYMKQLKKQESLPVSLVSRGFPDVTLFGRYLHQRLIDEVLVISSENKIKLFGKNMESLSKRTYNIPLRNELKIFKIRRIGERNE
ncbi:MAG: RsmG family class I SAM-dependent methyltransferase [Candidatus Omnitrophota bacterium]